MASLTYNPAVFSVPDEGAAKRIILTPQGGQGTDERWVRETPYLRDLILEHLNVSPGAMVVDFGCGIGRMAKALIEAAGVSVLGVDISQDMRGLAPGYVASPAFSVVSPEVFRAMVAGGLRVDAAISVWVLQHCLRPLDDIVLLRNALKSAGRLFAVNNVHRAVPTHEKAWANDGLNLRAALNERLAVVTEGALAPEIVGEQVSDLTFWGCYAQD